MFPDLEYKYKWKTDNYEGLKTQAFSLEPSKDLAGAVIASVILHRCGCRWYSDATAMLTWSCWEQPHALWNWAQLLSSLLQTVVN